MFESLKQSLTIPSSDVYKITGEDTEALQKALVIGTPSEPAKTPPSLNFERKREIEIPWKKVFSGIETGVEETVEPIRHEMETSVGQPLISLDIMVQENIDKLIGFYQALGPKGADNAVSVQRPTFADSPEGKDISIAAEVISEGIVFKHGSSRQYLLLPIDGVTLTLDDFKTLEAYRDTWKNKIAGVDLVFASDAKLDQVSSDYEEIDLRAKMIEEKFQELLRLKGFQQTLVEKSDPIIDSMIQGAVSRNLDLDEVERIQNKALQLKMADYRIETRIKRLIGQASEMGYLLFDKDQAEITFPDKSKITPKAGQLYQKYKRSARWSTTETVSRTVRKVMKVLFVKVKVKRRVKRKVQKQHVRIVEDYKLIDTSKDLLQEKILELRRQNFQVNVFRQTPQGYLSQDDVSLQAVMDACGRDERVRQRCVVILPYYEQAMTGERALVSYQVFKRPLPGIQPSAMPRLTLIESLSYRLAWTGTQLGELVSSLNLAPGESRTITMRKEYEKETSVTESRSSVFDLDRQESTDLADEMENQMRNEAEHSDETNMSMSASAKYGFVSGKASASHGTKNSLKSFSQGINKVARKASQSVNQKQKEEVSSSSTSRVKVSTFDETTANIENINQGRTLNLMFHRLYNRFKSGLFIEALRFQVVSSVEIIAGSGIQRNHYFSFDSFDDLMGEFSEYALPMQVAQADKYQYLTNVVSAIAELINQEYRKQPLTSAKPPASRKKSLLKSKASSSDATPNSDLASVSVLQVAEPEKVDKVAIPMMAVSTDASEQLDKLKQEQTRTNAEIKRLKQEDSRIQELYQEYEQTMFSIGQSLRTATLESSQAIANTEQELLVVAPGLYLDSTLGVQPGTEPYSEDMRAQKVRQEAADVAMKAAEAQYKLALAARLRGIGLAERGVDNWITGILPDPDSKTIQLRMKDPVEQGKWQLFVDGSLVSISKIDYVGRSSVSLTITDKQFDLSRDDLISALIELRDEKDGRVISTLV